MPRSRKKPKSASKKLHCYTERGEINNVTTFLRQLQCPYLNEKGESAAFVAIQHKQFKIYSHLLSHDIRFINDVEKDIINGLTAEERLELKSELSRNFSELNNEAVQFLLKRTKLVGTENVDKIKDIERYYKELCEIPEIGQIFSVIKCNGFVHIIFDFKMNSKIDMDQTVNTNVESTDIYENGCIYIGAQSNSENQLKGAIAHELTHYAMQILYSNFCKPFKKSDTLEENEFQIIVDVLQDLVFQQNSNGNSTRTNEFDDIIRLAFQCYDKFQWPAELIVRVNQMLAYYGLYEGEKLLNDQADNLLKYYRKYVMSHCEHFLENNYMFKPKAAIKNFNVSVGLVNRLHESSVKFEKKFCLEFEEFIKSLDISYLLISTSFPLLTTKKVYETLIQLDFDLNDYLLIDYETYGLGVIDRLILTAGCKLLILNVSENTVDNLPKLVQDLSVTLKVKPNFKTVFVANECAVAKVLKKLDKHYQNTLISDVNLSFSDLTVQSQHRLLSKEVEFQGEQIQLNKLIDENTTQLIDANTLAKLISNQKFKIGVNNVPKTFNPSTYIPRQLHCNLNSANNFTESEMPEQHEISLPLASTEDMLPVDSLANVVTSKSAIQTISETELIEMVANDKVVVIADIAGSGKSTLLTHITILIKQRFNDIWILRINFNHFALMFKEKLKTNNLFTTSETLDFLLNSQQLGKSDPENFNFFQNHFESNITKSIVMFDGFDEINPDYAAVAKSLINSTLKCGVKQIWLTTRPQCKKLLETEFQCKAFEINPLNEQHQLQYLVKFWESNLAIKDRDSELESFAEEVQELIKDTLSEKSNFMENPLMLMMFAEALLDACKDYLQSQENNCAVDIINIADLYETFITLKFAVYQNEKLKLDSSNNMRVKTVVEFIEIHQIAALKFYFSEKLSDLLLSNLKTIKEIKFDHIEACGLIKHFADNRPEFVHLTFAEYLVSRFIVKNILKQNVDDKVLSILIKSVFFEETFLTIRTFLNEMLSTEILDSINKHEELAIELEKSFNNEIFPSVSIALVESNDKIVQFFCKLFCHTNLMPKMLVSHQVTDSTILHLAVRKSNKELISMLIDDFNMDINTINKQNLTPLHVASIYSNKEIIEMLIHYKANINAVDEDGMNALHFAAAYNETDVIKTLIDDYKLDINSVDNDGYTPLHRAVAFNSKEVIDMLISHYNANVNAIGKSGTTVLHWPFFTTTKKKFRC
ncbi:hypothetical protein CHUAL_006777 [Chamberlinius hualienensis]